MRLVALALAALVLLPTVSATTPRPEFPNDLKTLLGKWIATEEALITDEDRGRPWFEGAYEFIARAHTANTHGRVREGMFHLETFHELLLTKRLMDEAATFANDGDRRVFAIQQLRATQSDANAAWAGYRERLHSYEDDIRSLQTLEMTLYSTDTAITGLMSLAVFDNIANALSKERGFPEGHVYALVRSSATPLMNMQWAEDMLTVSSEADGLPPQIVAERWANLTAGAINVSTQPAPSLEGLFELARPVRENGEGTLAFGFLLTAQRLSRLASMESIFGDATQRRSVLDDATRFMSNAANNTTLDAPRSVGLQGVFTSDALDRVILTQRYLDEGKAELPIVLLAWASIDYAAYATNALATVSPIVPPVEPEKEAPGVGSGLLVAVITAVVVARGRRS